MSANRAVYTTIPIHEQITHLTDLIARKVQRVEELSSEHKKLSEVISQHSKPAESYLAMGQQMLQGIQSYIPYLKKEDLNYPTQKIESLHDDIIKISKEISYHQIELKACEVKLASLIILIPKMVSSDCQVEKIINDLQPKLIECQQSVKLYLSNPHNKNRDCMQKFHHMLDCIIQNKDSIHYSLIEKLKAIEHLAISLPLQLSALKAKKWFFYPSVAANITEKCLKELPSLSYLQKVLDVIMKEKNEYKECSRLSH